MTLPRQSRRPLAWLVVLLLAAPSIAVAAEPDPEGQEETGRRLFPPFRKRAPPPTEPVEVAKALDPEAPAETVGGRPTEGIWDWVDRMDGEIPTPEQVAALQEAAEAHLAERSVSDDLTGGAVPVWFYDDPERQLSVDPLHLKDVDPKAFDIPIEVNAEVEKWMRYFTGSGRVHYAKWLQRASLYQPMMREALKAKGLPQDLVYLSMIESGYNPHAYSHADAAGLWQFIPSTGKVYDLRIDWWVDDRRDPEASLQAAMTFLGELHRMFGDWRLAFAAYNGGPGRVRRAIDKTGTRDFWQIAKTDALHPETENYVPKIMAAAIIGKNPERYGFVGITPQDPLRYDVVRVEDSVSFEVLARCAGTTVDTLKGLNPGLRRHATPPEGYNVRVPPGKQATFASALAAVPKSERGGSVERHTVHRGETLSTIAAKYGTSVASLSSANQLKNIDRIVVGMTLLVPPDAAAPPVVASKPAPKAAPLDAPPVVMASAMGLPLTGTAPAAKVKPATVPSNKPTVHVVVSGDTLSKLALANGTSVAALQKQNGLSGETITIGQRLQVPAGTAGVRARPAVDHVVAKGQTLSAIARLYEVDPSALAGWNRVTDPSHIEVGQKLTVYPNVQWDTYTVKKGDSLGRIASRSGCSVADLQAWNALATAVIVPGQALRIRVSNDG